MVLYIGVYWGECINNSDTSNLALHPGLMDELICPNTGKAQKYCHFMKFPEQPKSSKDTSNNIGSLLQVIGDIKGTDN